MTKERDDWTIYCDDCGFKVDEAAATLPEIGSDEPCPECGATSRVFRYNGPNAGFVVMRASVVKKPGEKRSPVESVKGAFLSRAIGRWVHVHRIIDRRRNRYYEKVLDVEAREVLREVDEPLTEHRGRGDAKPKSVDSSAPAGPRAGHRRDGT